MKGGEGVIRHSKQDVCTRDTESFVEWLNGEATEAEIADVEIDWDNEPAEAHNEGA